MLRLLKILINFMSDTPIPEHEREAAAQMEAAKEIPRVTDVAELDFDQDIEELLKLSYEAHGFDDPDISEDVEGWKKGVEERDQEHFLFGIRDENTGELISGAAMTVLLDDRGKKKGHFRAVATKDELGPTGEQKYRGRGLQKKMNEARMEKARELNLDYVDTLVKTHKPLAAMVKLKEGFVMTEPNREYNGFMLKKELNGERADLYGETTEIPYSETEKIYQLLEEGWEGIEIDSNGETDESNPEKWTLKMKKEVVPLVDDEQILEVYRLQTSEGMSDRPDASGMSPEQIEEVNKKIVENLKNRTAKTGAEFKFFGVRDKKPDGTPGELVAASMLLLEEAGGVKYAQLGSLTVKNGYRGAAGNYASQKLTAERMRMAEQDCDEVNTATYRFRPVAIRVKLREGFVIKHAMGGQRDVYYLEKNFKKPFTLTGSEAVQEISVDQTDRITDLIESGWVGTNIERTGTNKQTTTPDTGRKATIESGELKNWTMTLVKTKEE